MADKESVGGAFTVDSVSFHQKTYSGDTAYTIPVNVYYHWTPKIDLSAGYRYKNTNEDFGSDSQDNYFNVGARGEFTPKLTGTVDVGYEYTKYGSYQTTPKSNDSNLGYDANLTYTITPKTTLALSGSNAFTSDAFGNKERSFSVGLRGDTLKEVLLGSQPAVAE